MSDPRIKLEGYLDVPVERWAASMSALETHIELTRSEPGCIEFNVNPCIEIKHRLLVSELFENQTSFDAHQARAAQSEWAEISAGIPRQYEISEVK